MDNEAKKNKEGWAFQAFENFWEKGNLDVEKERAKENIWEKRDLDVEKERAKEERYRQAYVLEQEKVANEKHRIEMEHERLALQRRADDERIMTMDIAALPGPQQEYYLSLQREIMARRSMSG